MWYGYRVTIQVLIAMPLIIGPLVSLKFLILAEQFFLPISGSRLFCISLLQSGKSYTAVAVKYQLEVEGIH